MELKETFQQVKKASKTLDLLTDEQRNEVLKAVADAIIFSCIKFAISDIYAYLCRC